MSRLAIHAARLLPVALGIGALAFGPCADASASSASPPAGLDAQAAPSIVPLSYGRISRWAYPNVTAVARATPSPQARAVGRLSFFSPDGLDQAQIYQELREERVPATGVMWVDVSLLHRPNGSTGWVRASALGPVHTSYGMIVVDRARLRLTLYNRNGKAIFSAPVGIGRPSLPTPPGHFYVAEKFVDPIDGGVYGPFLLGTSAFAPTLSDWPGGGIIGIHGTDQPQLIPGRPSHGCIRLVNSAITRLWPLVTLGTRIDIT